MIRYLKTIAFFAIMAAFSSCLKDKAFDDAETGLNIPGSSKLIQLGGAGASGSTETLGFNLEDKAITATVVRARLLSGTPAPTDIVITLDTTGQSVQFPAGVVKLPNSFYTLPKGLTITIPAGQNEGTLEINTNAIQFNPSTTYGLAFKIGSISPSGYAVAQNFSIFYTLVGAKNSYDGVYTVVSGFVQRFSAPTTPTTGDALNGPLGVGLNPDVTMTTIDATTVSVANLTWATGGGIGGIDNLRLRVDPATNLVTMSALGNATLANWPGKVNKYDPATRTFTINFDWNQTANRREYSVVLKWKRPR